MVSMSETHTEEMCGEEVLGVECKRRINILLKLYFSIITLYDVKEAVGIPQNEVEKSLLSKISDIEKIAHVLHQQSKRCIEQGVADA